MKILDIYKKYQIMPQLAEHQFRVAAVADLIAQNFEGEIDRENIVKACLLHDMGNIVKFHFDENDTELSKLLKGQDLGFWKQVQQEYMTKYGQNSHDATGNILKELGIGGRVYELVDCIGFDKGLENAQTEDYGKKICAYSDMRVKPQGVVSLEERFSDLRKRYEHHREGTDRRDVFEKSLREIENQIFAQCKIRPE